MPVHMKTWSFGSEGEKYPDDGNGGISCLQNPKVVRIHGFREFWFGEVGVVRVVLDLVNNGQFQLYGKYWSDSFWPKYPLVLIYMYILSWKIFSQF